MQSPGTHVISPGSSGPPQAQQQRRVQQQQQAGVHPATPSQQHEALAMAAPRDHARDLRETLSALQQVRPGEGGGVGLTTQCGHVYQRV